MAVQVKRLPRQFRSEAKRIMRSPAMQAEVKNRADRIRQAAGEGHETSIYMRMDRATASVRTASFRARYTQARYRRLSRSIDAGRG